MSEVEVEQHEDRVHIQIQCMSETFKDTIALVTSNTLLFYVYVSSLRSPSSCHILMVFFNKNTFYMPGKFWDGQNLAILGQILPPKSIIRTILDLYPGNQSLLQYLFYTCNLTFLVIVPVILAVLQFSANKL